MLLCLYCVGKEGEGGEKEEEAKKEEEKVEVEELEMEEPAEPPRPSLLTRALTRFQDDVWPKISWMFIFKINRDGRVGTFLRVFGCLAAFLSCFTITYQVIQRHVYIATLFRHNSFFHVGLLPEQQDSTLDS